MSEKDISKKIAGLSPEKRQILLKKIQQASKNKPEKGLKNITGSEKQQFSELSYAQQRLWFLNELEGPSAVYNMPALLGLTGELDHESLRLSIESIIKRHEILRSVFVEVNGIAYQKTLDPFEYPLEIFDLSELEDKERTHQYDKLISELLLTRFDLKKGPLFFIKLIKLQAEEVIMVINMHHIISDGWSTGIMVNEVSTLYNAYLESRPASLDELKIQYSDYARWQREYLNSDAYAKKLDFWKYYLQDVSVLELPLDKKRPAVQSARGAHELFSLSQEDTSRVKKLAEKNNTTVFNLLLAVYYAFLYRYTGQSDITVGVPVANRGRREIESLIGFFVNTITLRQNISGSKPFSLMLETIKGNAVKAFDNQEIPFEKLVDELGVVRDMSQSPLFQTMFSYQEQQMEKLELKNAKIDFLPFNIPTAKFDLSLSFVKYVDRLEGAFEYCTDLFETSTIKNMVSHFKNLLSAILINPDQKISSLPMLNDKDWQWLEKINENKRPQNLKLPVHQQIEKQAEKTPDNIAIIYGDVQLSYRDLNERANQLARFLQTKDLKEKQLVGVCFERSSDLIISILAILKSGASYVPLDPSYPKQRLAFMIENSDMPMLLSHKGLIENSEFDVELIDLNYYDSEISREGKNNLPEKGSLDDLLYVIFTSGSTGIPKCTGAKHQAENNLLQWYTDDFKLIERDRVLLLSAIGFDLTQKNIFAPLVKGAALVIPEGRYFELDELLDLIYKAEVSWINCAPSAFYPLAEKEENFQSLKTLRYVFLGGEPIKHKRLKLWHEQSDCSLVNSYGPTECADITTYHYFTAKDWVSESSAPIGISIPNVELLVLGENREVVPPGAKGELCIGGISVGPGYLKDKILNAEKFIKYPEEYINKSSYEKLYKTGDRVRFRKDGTLEYLGRLDHQVKLRGYRIELGEIENQLNTLSSVDESAVLMKEDSASNPFLIAYIVLSEEEKESDQKNVVSAARNSLKEKLPDYMIPAQFLVLEELPLTANGKIDRKSLLAIELHPSANEDLVLPESEKEKILEKIWCEVLNRKQISIHENFFDLGGDSILSIQIVTRARRAGFEISARQIFENQSIAELAKVIEWGRSNIRAEQGAVEGISLLNPVQRWFFEEPLENQNHWNQSVLLDLGSEVSVEHVKKAVKALIQQHDALRLSFTINSDNNIEARYLNIEDEINFNEYSFKDSGDIEKAIYSVQKSLTISQGRVIGLGFIHDKLNNETENSSKESNKLFIAIHHLIVDGVSWRIILEDLNLAIQQIISNSKIDFGIKTSSFKEYAEELDLYCGNHIQEETRQYWLDITAETLPDLPFLDPVGSNRVKDVKTLCVRLGSEKTSHLLKSANQAYRTNANELLLTALALSVTDWTKTNKLLLALEGHGRQEFSEKIDLSKTVGWFTTLYPLLINLPESKDISQVIKIVKEQKRSVPNDGFDYGLLRYGDNREIADKMAKITPHLVFNYLGQLDLNQDSMQHFALSDQDYSHTNLDSEDKRKHTIEINGGVKQGCLELYWSFSDKQFDPETIQLVADNFISKLEDIIDHCLLDSSYGLSPVDFPLATLSQAEVDNILQNQSKYFGKKNIQDVYPLSPLQAGMLFHALHQEGTGLYCEQVRIDINDKLDSELIKEAWQRAVDKFSALRTGFIWDSLDQPLQCIHKDLPVSISDYDGDPGKFDSFLNKELKKGFDLNKPGLLKIFLCKLDENSHSLGLMFHHIIMDGWSLSIVLAEVFNNYNDLFENKNLLQSKNSGSTIGGKADYRSYIEYILGKKKLELLDEKQYWEKYLGDTDELVELPSDYYMDRGQGPERKTLSISLPSTLAKEIESLSKEKRITHNVFYQGVWSLLLSQYSTAKDLIFGTTLSGRPADLPDNEQLVGLFINTLPVRINFNDIENEKALEFLTSLQKQQLETLKHQYSSLSNIKKWIGKRTESELFETLFVYENYPVDQVLAEDVNKLNINSVSTEWRTNYPLTLVINPGIPVEIKISYDINRYSKEFIQDVLNNFINTSQSLIEKLDSPIKQISALRSEEQTRLLEEWNNTASMYESNASIAEIFENQVMLTPDKVAIRFKESSLSYKELNGLANQWAEKIKQTAGENHEPLLVALCAERSIEMLVAILAIIKSDAAYVPLDANYPVERLQYMLKDTGAKLLLLQRGFQNSFDAFDIEKLFLEDDVSQFSPENKSGSSDANSLAYIMYTSGSTGQPKGIKVRHRNIARLVRNTDYMMLDEGNVFLQYAPISFDAATLEIWGPLLNGGALVVAPPGHLEMEQLANIFHQESINTVWLTAALFHYLAEYHLDAFKDIKQLLAGGDVLSPELVKKVLNTYPGITLINGYGPTENTTFTCCYPMTSADQVNRTVPIGRPIANTQVYILNEELQAVPVGMPGELYTAGDGISGGYINKPELTESVFLQNPYAKEFNHGPVLYKTGDMARYLTDGNIEYLGRIDQQVKIRGYRIELSEIEAALKKLDFIREVVVIAREDKSGTKKLFAYMVAEKNHQTPENQIIRQALNAELPDYMLPSSYTWLEELPVTANGKLDRKALPEPEIILHRSRKHVDPKNEKERILKEIWEEVLSVKDIGINDNYFELGGDSILSIQIVSRAKKHGLIIHSRQLFELQTIAALAQNAETKMNIVAEQGVISKKAKLTPIQHWFFEQKLEHANQWNMSALLKLNDQSGIKRNYLELEELFKSATYKLIKQHDILRSIYLCKKNQIDHDYLDPAGTYIKESFSTYDLSEESLETDWSEAFDTCIKNIQQSFDLAEGPLFKLALIKIGDDYRVFITAHHLIIDGVSWRILLEDLNTLLVKGDLDQETENLLDEKTTSFADWSEALTEYASSTEVEDQLTYWNQLPYDKVSPLPVKNHQIIETENTVESTISIEQVLSASRTRQLLQDANKAYKTEINDLLITSLAMTLSEWRREKFLLIDLEGHGREHISDSVDVSRTVGWFTSSFPVLLEMDISSDPDDDLSKFIKSVKEQLRAIPGKGLSYGLLKYIECNTSADTSIVRKQNSSEINFNYLGQIDSTFAEGSLLLPAEEAAGHDRHVKNNQTHLLDIYGIVINDQLKIGWRFSQNLFDETEIEKLVKRNIENLEKIIEFCLQEKNRGFTPSDFPLANLDQEQLDKIVERYSDIEDLYPLSAMQQGMLFHAQMESETGIYFEQHIVELKGKLDKKAFASAWNSVIRQHEILRTSFLWEEVNEPLQLVHSQCDISVELTDQIDDLEEFLQRDRIRGFKFDEAPLTRVILIPVSDSVQKMVWSFHHILLDGWSVAKVIADVFTAYEAIVQGLKPEQRPVVRYSEYIEWLQNIDKTRAETFWTHYLSGFNSITPLGMRSLVSLREMQAGESKPIKDFVFDQDINENLEKFCKDHRLTVNTVFQAAWAFLLSSYSGNQNVIYGVTVSGRPPELSGVEDMVGLFINTLPLRVTIEDELSVLEWLNEIQQKQIELRSYETTPLYEIQQCSELDAENNLFESLLVFENYPVNDVLRNSSLSVEFSNISSVEQTNFPITIVVMPGKELEMRIAYDASGFTDVVINRIFRQFSQLLKNIIENPFRKLEALSATNSEEIDKVVNQWNRTSVDSDLECNVIEVFEKNALEMPDQLAVVDEFKSLTYSELNNQANKIARHLESKGVSRGDFVAVLGARSVDFMTGILGSLKAGAAYIPVDPAYPIGRVEHILKDANVKVVITSSEFLDKLDNYSHTVINMDKDQGQFDKYSLENLNKKIDCDDYAYCIYTSGSTGVAKGVIVQHKALKNLCNWQGKEYEITGSDNVSLIASEGFDASICEIWPGLVNGACLYISNNEIRLDPEKLISWLSKNKINVAFLPTPIAENLLINNIDLPDCIRILFVGGDRLTQWPERWQSFKFYNVYGPTEATVVTTVAELSNQKGVGLPPIGRPISNYQTYVLDRHLSPVPVGVPGELFIGGKGLAWGYLNQPGLTEEKFINNPFSKVEGDRLYRTGDLVRYEEDGSLKFMGRIKQGVDSDDIATRGQVKIRGFRIELGEIETVLDKQEEVSKAIVVAKKYNGQKYLVAYIVPRKSARSEKDKLPEQLKAAIEKYLPEYMLPSAIIPIDSVPLSLNGKVDYNQLPEVDFQKFRLADYVEPRTEMEYELASIWQNVLGVDQVGVFDSFFELGGHSILITKVNSRIKEKLNVEIPLKTLFELSTVAAQAELIETLKWQDDEAFMEEDDDYEEGTL